MAEALRAALRFLPAVKPSSVAGTRALVYRDRSVVFSLVTQQNVAKCERKQQAAVGGLAKFARTVLAYVGAGISTIAASQISGPAIVEAKEVSVNSRSMAAAEMRAAWHRTAATCYWLHEDSKRTSKLGHPTSELSEPQTTKQDQVSKFQSESGKCDSFSLSDGWSSINSHYFMDKKLDFHFQVATDIENDAESQLKGLSEVTMDAASSDWETIESSCASGLPISQEKVSENKADEVVGKDEGNSKGGKVNVREEKATRFLESKIQQVQQPLMPLPRKFDHVNQAVSSGMTTWRNADKGELAALIAKKSLEDIENCDLPPALSPVAKGVLGKVDVSSSRKDDFLQISRAVDRNVLASILQGDEPARLETQALPPSPFTFRSLGPLDFSQVKQAASSKKQCQHEYRADTEVTDWRSLVPESNSELLGEALCRSQTRAREAEKRAAEAVMEKEQLLKLFFRESSISLTYKHWVKYLQAENLWLRLRAEDESGEEAEHDSLNPFIAFQQLSNNRWKRCKKTSQELVKFKKRKHSDHSAAVLGCTVGLAFALGVSLAGAGLMFGCTLGWILIAF